MRALIEVSTMACAPSLPDRNDIKIAWSGFKMSKTLEGYVLAREVSY
ncbi:MAG TPA: hypothetical protein VK574_13785 [Terracidiphilus sp.]|nr:hypothetical protein [Terracidiphilus sp.]